MYIVYILQPWLLVVHIQVVYTVNMVVYRKHLFTTSCVYGTESPISFVSCNDLGTPIAHDEISDYLYHIPGAYEPPQREGAVN